MSRIRCRKKRNSVGKGERITEMNTVDVERTENEMSEFQKKKREMK